MKRPAYDKPIDTEADFLNQKLIRKQIAVLLRNGGSCVIIGGKGMGKTSLLWNIHRRYEKPLSPDDDIDPGAVFVPVFVQFRANESLDLRICGSLLVTKCIDQVRNWFVHSAPNLLDTVDMHLPVDPSICQLDHAMTVKSVSIDLCSDLHRIISAIRLHSWNARLLLLLDDLDSLPSNVLDDFLRVLRPLVDHEDITQSYKLYHQHVRMVLASSSSLFSRGTIHLWRTTYRITPVELQVFKIEDLYPCLTQLCEEGLEHESALALIDELHELVGGHPLLLQTVLNSYVTRELLEAGGSHHFDSYRILELIDQSQSHIRQLVADIIQENNIISTLVRLLLESSEDLTVRKIRDALHNSNIDEELRTLLVWGIVRKKEENGVSLYRISGKFVEHWFQGSLALSESDGVHLVTKSKAMDSQWLDSYRQALVNAYTYSDLNLLIAGEFGTKLEDIAMGNSLIEVVFKLTEWARMGGKLQNLIEASIRHKPESPYLRSFRDTPQ